LLLAGILPNSPILWLVLLMFKSKSVTHECVEHDTHVLLSCAPRLPVLVVCDHASRQIPAEMKNLGMSEAELATHRGWDIGAGAVARELGSLLGVPVVLASNSRLVVDCNRTLDDPTAFPQVSDGVPVPGNAELTAGDREARANAFYWPYHHAIRDQLTGLEKLAPAPALIAVHSFTPELDGFKRPWHVGALWDKDSRIAMPFMGAFADHPDIVVGDNEPYSGRHPADFTLDHHAEAEGLPHLAIEIRQELIATQSGAAHWAKILFSVLQNILADEALYTHRAGQV
jgi:predicted N-formylglutamate amidohydrolase